MNAAHRRCGVAMAIAALSSIATPAVADGRRLYEVVTETGMPHLDESLRYAVRSERTCLDPSDLSGAFWMLRDVSLQDCRLVKALQDEASAAYALQCDGGHGTTGGARWQFEPAAGGGTRLAGTLNVRLGGKNMTFHQRVKATPVGECP